MTYTIKMMNIINKEINKKKFKFLIQINLIKEEIIKDFKYVII